MMNNKCLKIAAGVTVLASMQGCTTDDSETQNLRKEETTTDTLNKVKSEVNKVSEEVKGKVSEVTKDVTDVAHHTVDSFLKTWSKMDVNKMVGDFANSVVTKEQQQALLAKKQEIQDGLKNGTYENAVKEAMQDGLEQAKIVATNVTDDVKDAIAEIAPVDDISKAETSDAIIVLIDSVDVKAATFEFGTSKVTEQVNKKAVEKEVDTFAVSEQGKKAMRIVAQIAYNHANVAEYKVSERELTFINEVYPQLQQIVAKVGKSYPKDGGAYAIVGKTAYMFKTEKIFKAFAKQCETAIPCKSIPVSKNYLTGDKAIQQNTTKALRLVIDKIAQQDINTFVISKVGKVDLVQLRPLVFLMAEMHIVVNGKYDQKDFALAPKDVKVPVVLKKNASKKASAKKQ